MPNTRSFPKQVLLVDDDALLRVIADSFFRANGAAQLVAAPDGETFERQLQPDAELPDLILADPGVSGLGLERLFGDLRQRGYRAPLVLLNSGRAPLSQTAQQLAQAHELNIVAVLQKPLRPRELDTALRKARQTPTLRQPALFADGKAEFSEDELRQAISKGEIIVYHQPVVATGSAHIASIEALARWRHPQHGLLDPAQFIGLSERADLIRPLTHRVCRLAFRDARRLAQLRMNIRSSINLSGNMLADGALPDEIDFIVDGLGLSAELFAFEVDERVILDDDGRGLRHLARLRSLGYRVVIDNFGLADEPWTQLRHMPVDEVKLPVELAGRAQYDEAAHRRLRSCVELARDAGFDCIAKGVETIADWHFLADEGVDHLQGFYVARPMPFDELLVSLVESGGMRSPDLITVPEAARTGS